MFQPIRAATLGAAHPVSILLTFPLLCLLRSDQVDKTFQVVHTDPWLWGDPHRTSRTISFMNNRSSGVGSRNPGWKWSM